MRTHLSVIPRLSLELLSLGLTLALVQLLPAVPAAADWPQHRGPARNAKLENLGEDALANSWPKEGPPLLWEASLGPGFSGLSIVGERLFTLFADAETEFAAAFDATNGRELWRRPLGPRFEDSWGDGPRSTPTVDAGVVFALGSHGQMVALDAATGTELWSRDLLTLGNGEDGSAPVAAPHFGYSPSPLLAGNRLLVEAGSGPGRHIVALDRRDGRLLWSWGDGQAGYSSPVLLPKGEEKQAVFLTRDSVLGLSLDGRLLWRWPLDGGSRFDLPIATPTPLPGGRVFVSHRAEGGSALLAAPQGSSAAEPPPEPRVLWAQRLLQSHFHGAIHHGKRLYSFHNATLKAVDLANGTQIWAHRGLGKGSLLLLGESLLVLGDQGLLVLLDASASTYQELARHQTFDEPTWTPPSFSRGRLYLRTGSRMAAFDLRPQGQATLTSVAAARPSAETVGEDQAVAAAEIGLTDILNRYRQAIGAETWHKMPGLRLNGTYSTNGYPAPQEVLHRADGLYRLRRETSAVEEALVAGFDGQRAWVDGTKNPEPGRASSLRAEAPLLPTLLRAREGELHFQSRIQTELGPALVILFEPKEGWPETWHLDPATYLPRAMQTQRWAWGRLREIRYTFTDYRPIPQTGDGPPALLPFRIEDEFSTFLRVFRIETAESEETLASSLFQTPRKR